MYKKGIVLLSGLLLMAACGDKENETEVNDPTNGEEPEEVVDENTNTSSHLFSELVNESTFTEEYGLQAWDDYQAIIEDVSLGESTILNQEDGSLEDLDGTSSSEIKEKFAALDLRDDVFQDEALLSEDEKMILYRYPPASDSDLTEVADFLAELTFYYADDNLMYTSITPGFYTLELNDLPSTEDLTRMVTVSEIEEINPKIYTIAEMQVNGDNIQQVMVPSMHVNEEGEEVIMAFYFFAKGDTLLQFAYLPFEMVSQDFPTNSILLYYQLIPELEKELENI